VALVDYWHLIKKAVAVNSTAVDEVTYDENKKIMIVKFHNGRIYEYSQVPKEEYETVIHAKSVGTYMNEEIVKPQKYAYKELV
jgi:hypothetical protein